MKQREIKFRCWDKKKKEMKGVLALNFSRDITKNSMDAGYNNRGKGYGGFISAELFYDENWNGRFNPPKNTPANCYVDKRVDWNKIILMQFTGLKDKNGKEIWEGDIVKVETKEIFIVEWYKKGTSFRYVLLGNKGWLDSNSPLNYDEVEVIGNIYKNPELLNIK